LWLREGLYFGLHTKKESRRETKVVFCLWCIVFKQTPLLLTFLWFFPPHILAFVVWALKIKAPCSVQRHTASCGKNPSLHTSKRVLPRNYHDLYNCLLYFKKEKNCMVFYPSPYPLWKLFSSPQRKVTKYSSQFICHVDMRFLRPLYLTICEKNNWWFLEKNHTCRFFQLDFFDI